MKKAIALASSLLLFAGAAMAADIARLDDVTIEGQTSHHTSQFREGSVLVVSVTVDTFSDNAPLYAAAFGGADLVYDPQLYGWPDLSGYDVMIVVYNDCWWDASLGAFSSADEAVMAGFAGNIMIVGQDYIYSLFGASTWLRNTFGIASVVEDINFGDASVMTLAGLAGGPFEGLGGSGVPCWEANPWFTDDVSYNDIPTQDWSGGGFAGTGGAAKAGAIFSVNAYECFDTFTVWSAAAMEFLGGDPVPTVETTWSSVKAQY